MDHNHEDLYFKKRDYLFNLFFSKENHLANQLANQLPFESKTFITFIFDILGLKKYSAVPLIKTPRLLIVGHGLGDNAFSLEKKLFQNRDYFDDYQIMAIDSSAIATEIAKKRQRFYRGSKIIFEQKDILHFSFLEKWDYIIDNHLLHCLIDNKTREQYLKIIHSCLNKNGSFLFESLVGDEYTQCDLLNDEYILDQDFVLWKKNTTNDFLNELSRERIHKKFSFSAVRKALPSYNLEQEILASGLKIACYFYRADLKYIVGTDFTLIGENQSKLTFPCIQVAAVKNEKDFGRR